jgi:hypothetical protein
MIPQTGQRMEAPPDAGEIDGLFTWLPVMEEIEFNGQTNDRPFRK